MSSYNFCLPDSLQIQYYYDHKTYQSRKLLVKITLSYSKYQVTRVCVQACSYSPFQGANKLWNRTILQTPLFRQYKLQGTFSAQCCIVTMLQSGRCLNLKTDIFCDTKVRDIFTSTGDQSKANLLMVVAFLSSTF